jgi:preprotein translocase subunit SecG
MLEAFLCILWIFVSLFLVLIILLQRGKGGGLAGALGGVGGSSAFGTKAGDIFTRITVGVFAVWLLLAMSLVWKMKPPARFIGAAGPAAKEAKDAATGGRKLADDDIGKGPGTKGIEVKGDEGVGSKGETVGTTGSQRNQKKPEDVAKKPEDAKKGESTTPTPPDKNAKGDGKKP